MDAAETKASWKKQCDSWKDDHKCWLSAKARVEVANDADGSGCDNRREFNADDVASHLCGGETDDARCEHKWRALRFALKHDGKPDGDRDERDGERRIKRLWHQRRNHWRALTYKMQERNAFVANGRAHSDDNECRDRADESRAA